MENSWDMSQAGAWLVMGLITMISYPAFHCIYSLYFHPLSRFPGPFLAKLTDAYSAFRSYQGNMHVDVQECHRKYGKVIRYGPNRLLTLDPTDFQSYIYGYGKPFRKAQSYATMVPWAGGETTATAIDKELHKNLRHTFISGLSRPSLKKFEPAVIRNLDLYFQKLLEGPRSSSGWSQARNMNLWNQWLSFDTMADFAFGIKIGFLEDQDTRILDILHMHSVKLGVYEQWPNLTRIGISSCISWILLRLSSKVQYFDSWFRKFAEENIAKNCRTRSGILAQIIEGVNSDRSTSGYTKMQMLAEGSFTIFTASEGNATILSAVQFYLVHNKDVYIEVTREIRERFSPGETIYWGPELASCEYLRACIDEGLRMLPPASGAHWRESEKEGILVNGEEYPAGCDIGVSLPALFQSHDIFRDADRFWPHRWLESVLPEEELATARKAFKPFSTGPRACVGQTTSIMVTSVSLANLLNKYDFRCCLEPHSSGGNMTKDVKESDDQTTLRFENHFTSSWKEGPFIHFRERAM